MSSYPIVKIPAKLEEISSLYPPKPAKPVAPAFPQRTIDLPKLPQEEEIKEPSYTHEGVGCFGFILAASVIFFSY